MIIESALTALMFFFFILGLLHATDITEDTHGNITQQAPVFRALILLSAAVVFFSTITVPLGAIIATAVSTKPHVTVRSEPGATNITITYSEPASASGPPIVSPYYAIITAVAALAPSIMYYIGYVIGDYLIAEEKMTWKPPSLLAYQRVVVIEEAEKPREVVKIEKEVTYLDELVT